MAAFGTLSANETNNSYSASAFALEGGELLYVERHVEIWRENRLAEREVSYVDPSGGLIAEKRVRYGESREAPSFEMTDYRTGTREGAEVTSDEIALFSGPVGESNRPRSLPRPKSAVVDAGFDAFMRDNFAAVVTGQRLEFEFAVPAARRFFRFQLVPEGQVSYGGDEAWLVTMRPASAFLRLLVDPIELVYSRDGRLLEFRGLANISDAEGDRYEARIVFDYTGAGSGRGEAVAP